MASPELLDFESLTAPISDDNPVGGDPREDPSPNSIYQQIKIARDAARNAERMAEGGEEEAGAVVPEWRTIATLAPKLLSTQAKDLEVAIFLLEAMLREGEFAGLRDGLRAIRELVEHYFETMHPLEEYQGKTTDFELLNNLNGLLPQPIQRLHITQGSSVEPFAPWQYAQANQVALISDPQRKQARIDAGAVTFDQIATAVRESEPRFFLTLKEDVAQAFDEFRKLDTALEERCGSDAPSLGRVREVLQIVTDAIEHITKDVTLPETGDGEAAAETPGAGEAAGAGAVAAGSAAPAGGPVRGRAADAIETREDAFRMLLKVADFFRRMEPHSPLSYTLEELVRRGRMPLQDLLAELIPDADARNGFLMRAGIEPPQEEGY